MEVYKFIVNISVCGFGRIGRGIIKCLVEISSINHIEIIDPLYNIDLVYDYLLWDSVYGWTKYDIINNKNGILYNDKYITISNAISRNNLVINATGELNLDIWPDQKCYITDDSIKQKNQSFKDPSKFIFLGTCDSRAIIPIIKISQTKVKLKHISICTVHPVMNSQPFLDRGVKKTIYQELERSALRNLIPKDTSLKEIVIRELDFSPEQVFATSFRSPHDSVTSAIIDLSYDIEYKDRLIDYLSKSIVFSRVTNNAVSSQMIGEMCVLLLSLSQESVNQTRIAILYDNEMGYCKSVVREIKNKEGLS